MSPLPAELEPGTEVDGFRIEERLHAGGAAIVYAVSGGAAPFPLVMKVPRLGHGEPAWNVISFETEARLLRVLHGPHLPRLVAAGDVTRRPYLVLERIPGRPLEAWLGNGPVPAPEVARLGAALAAALHDLHLQHVVHLDVKPSNAILRPDGGAVLVDLGVARHAHHPDLLAEELRHPVGSAPYISPEQVAGVRGDPRSDVFSLGAVLYELATGRLPFGSPSTPAGLRARRRREPVPPRALVPGVPAWLQEVILRCLEPDARDRYANAAQVARDLSSPEGIAPGERGARVRRSGRPRAARQPEAPGPPSQLRAPVVLVAVAAHRPDEARFEALREGVRRVLDGAAEARVACVAVIPPTPGLGGARTWETAGRRRIRHLAVLREFVDPLGLAAGRVSLHVVEAADAAAALVAHATANAVDHLVIGAPPLAAPAAARAGTVSLRVAASAPCTVTLVRPPGGRGVTRRGGSRGPSSRA